MLNGHLWVVKQFESSRRVHCFVLALFLCIMLHSFHSALIVPDLLFARSCVLVMNVESVFGHCDYFHCLVLIIRVAFVVVSVV